MAVQAFPYLVMTDGTLTATFADGLGGASSYAPLRGAWAPAIATRRRAALGRGPWQEVIEEWDLIVKGADTATALSNLETLVRLLDNADRFWRLGENVSPVLLKYVPQGSTLFTTANPATCLVIGRAPGDETNLSLPAAFNDVGMLFEMRPVHLRFFRTGQWLNPTAETGASGAAANPTVQSVTLTSTLTISSPTIVQIAWSATLASSNTGVLLYASATNRLQIYEAESGTLQPNVTSVADAANRARGGSVMRYSPVATPLISLNILTIAGFDSASRRVGIWAAVRNNSATTTWQIQAQAEVVTFTPLVTIDTSTTSPRLVFLGIVSLQFAFAGLVIWGSASAAAGTLDIDYLVVIALDDEKSGAVVVSGNQAAASPLVVDPRALTDETPRATYASTFLATYLGDGMLHTAGQTVAATILSPTGTFWRQDTGAAVVNNTLTVTRNNGYLSPR